MGKEVTKTDAKTDTSKKCIKPDVSGFKIIEGENGSYNLSATCKYPDIILKQREESIDAKVINMLNRLYAVDALDSFERKNIDAKSVLAFGDSLPVGSFDFRTIIPDYIINVDNKNANGNLAAVLAMEPTDAIETMLCSQMAATHSAAMHMLGKMNHASTIETVKLYEVAANKLMRTYTAQMEALRKHRGKGTQTVRHVHVNDGGQAIVADTVNHGGGGQE